MTNYVCVYTYCMDIYKRSSHIMQYVTNVYVSSNPKAEDKYSISYMMIKSVLA